MPNFDQPRPRPTDDHQPTLVHRPAPYEGVRRALSASFTVMPAAPDDFSRLLSQLR